MPTFAQLLQDARARLAGSPGEPSVPREALGLLRRSRWRADRIVRAGEAWHLGVLLVTDDGVLQTGEVLRAAAEVRRGYAAESARARAERRAQASRGGFAEGEVLHLDWQVLDVARADAGESQGPLMLHDGVPSVRWSAAGGLMPLRAYLDDQIGLLRG